MKVSDIVAQTLYEQGFRHVFAISGGASLHLIHSCAENPGLEVICPQHEQAGAMAADAYSRLTDGKGCAIATSGPGATNLISGIAGAYYDSVPALFLTGNVARFRDKGDTGVRQMGFQETEFVEMCESITNYAVKVNDPRFVRYELLKALYLSRTGRPGPVVVDLPDDLQRMDFDPTLLEPWQPPVEKLKTQQTAVLNAAKTTLDWLREAERPCLVLGWGIHLAGVEKEVRELVDTLQIPVVMTWAALDLLPHDHHCAVGGFGTHGNRFSNFAVQNADLILALGSRLDTKATGSPPSSFARGAKIVMVDIDSSELGKFTKLDKKIDLAVQADVRDFIPALLAEKSHAQLPKYGDWWARVNSWVKDYPRSLPEHSMEEEVNPYHFIKTLSALLQEGDIIVSETGCALAWTMQAFEFKERQRFFHAFNFTAMGWGLPAAIGAAFAAPGRRIICVAGDGSLQMNIQELVTVTRHNLPIKIILINNHGHGMVQQTQEMWLGAKYYATSVEGGLAFPDFIRVAQAYDYPTVNIERNADVESGLRKALESPSYFFANVEISAQQRVVPQVQFGRPNEDASPLLEREEFLKNLLITPLPVSLTPNP